MIIGVIAVTLIFGLPIVGIITSHFEKQSKIKHEMIKDQLQLEKLKNENYLIETDKMRLELEKMKIDQPKHEIKF
jgi:hypothetical protein